MVRSFERYLKRVRVLNPHRLFRIQPVPGTRLVRSTPLLHRVTQETFPDFIFFQKLWSREIGVGTSHQVHQRRQR